jgi:hypothetical protein
MTLPEGFNAFEHLQDTWRRVHNRRVREHFSDLSDPDADWNPTIEDARGGLRVACTMGDNDTADMTIIRTLLFWIVLGEASALQTPVYGIPVPSFQEARQFRLQIQLYFTEDFNDIEAGFAPVTGEINFRLANESYDTITEQEVRQYAQKIKTAFASNNGFVWRKGKVMVTYTDRQRGYKLQMLCRTKQEGKRVIEQVLGIQDHAPDWKFMNVSENEEPTARYPSMPRSERILNKTRRMPRARPIADVRFRYALMHVHGLPHPIVLVDSSDIFRRPVVEV